MGFVQISFLSALAALAVPIIIHLMFRRRARRVDFGTLRFLRIVLHENARRRKLKRWLLLALRCACLALLAVLFARPYLIAREPGGAERLVVILIDQSASMGLDSGRGRLLDLALHEAKKVVDRAGEGTQLAVALFDSAVHPIGQHAELSTQYSVPSTQLGRAPSSAPADPDATPQAAASGASRSPAASLSTIRDFFTTQHSPLTNYSSTNYGQAIAWARDVCVQSDRASKDLYIFTDLQRSGLEHADAEPMPQGVDVHLVDLGQAFAKNVAVTGIKLTGPIVRPGEAIAVTATLANSGPFPAEKVPMLLHLESGGKKQEWRQQVSVESDTTATVEFDPGPLAEGVWQGFVAAEWNDELKFDNRRYLALMVAPPVPVLLVDGEPGSSAATSETYFLESALRLASPGETYSDSPFDPQIIAWSEKATLPELKKYGAVVLANVGSVSSRDAGRLAEFVEQGGGLLVFTGKNVQAESCRSLAAVGLSAGEITGVAAPGEFPWRFESWDENHAVFRPFADPEHGDLRRLAFSSFTRIKPATEARVLARFRGGEPAVLELLASGGRQPPDQPANAGRSPARSGRVLWFASACDRDWSDWPRSRLFLPMVHQMLRYLAGLADGGPIREKLIDEIEPAGSSDGSDPEKNPVPGVFALDRTWQVVNVDPRESALDRCTADDFAARFGFRLEESGRPGQDGQGTHTAAGFDLREDEVWHWVILALIAASLIETFLGNRTAA